MTLSRQLSKERTRARLIQGTLKVLYKEGSAALTTGRIAESAGVAQPTFYVHFSSIDDALHHASELVCDRWLRAVRTTREEHDDGDAGQSVRGVLARYIDAMVIDPKVAELFLRHRRDSSLVLGRAFRRLTDRARLSLVEDIAAVSHASVDEILPCADFLLGAVLGAVEILLDRKWDREAAIAAAATMVDALVVSRAGIAQAAE